MSALWRCAWGRGVEPLEELGVVGGGELAGWAVSGGEWLGVLPFAARRPVAGREAAGGVAGRVSAAF